MYRFENIFNINNRLYSVTLLLQCAVRVIHWHLKRIISLYQYHMACKNNVRILECLYYYYACYKFLNNFKRII